MSFNIMLKPVGAACNLECRYCYYLDKRNLYPDAAHTLMSDDLLEYFVRQYIEAQPTLFPSINGRSNLSNAMPDGILSPTAFRRTERCSMMPGAPSSGIVIGSSALVLTDPKSTTTPTGGVGEMPLPSIG